MINVAVMYFMLNISEILKGKILFPFITCIMSTAVSAQRVDMAAPIAP